MFFDKIKYRIKRIEEAVMYGSKSAYGIHNSSLISKVAELENRFILLEKYLNIHLREEVRTGYVKNK